MTSTWDQHANHWDQDSLVRHYADNTLKSLTERMDFSDGAWRSKRLLDFGCGTGLLTEKLAPLFNEVIAVDTSPNMIDVLNGKNVDNVTAVCADIDDMASGSPAPWFRDFELIVASSVCGFLPDYETTLGVLSRALNKDGRFVQWDWLSSGDDASGLTMERVSIASAKAGLASIYIGNAFTMTIEGEAAPVMMGIGQKRDPIRRLVTL